MSEPTTDAAEPQGEPADLNDSGKALIKAERDRANTLDRELRALKEQLGDDKGAAALLSTRAENAKLADELGKTRKQLDEINAANMSDLEKAQKAAADAQAAADKATAEALRLRVAAKHGISDEDADLFLTGSDEETLKRQAARLTERATPGAPGTPKPDATQGGNAAAPALNSNALEEALKAKLGISA